MEIKKANINDFDIAFSFIERLWTYNTYNRNQVYNVYKEVVEDDNSFAFFLIDSGKYVGFCHGDYFNTFWMSGLTCYVSSIIVDESLRGKGYGKILMDYAKKLAVKKGCKALILDSGIPRKEAHGFYEKYGFEKSCYGFEMIL